MPEAIVVFISRPESVDMRLVVWLSSSTMFRQMPVLFIFLVATFTVLTVSFLMAARWLLWLQTSNPHQNFPKERKQWGWGKTREFYSWAGLDPKVLPKLDERYKEPLGVRSILLKLPFTPEAANSATVA